MAIDGADALLPVSGVTRVSTAQSLRPVAHAATTDARQTRSDDPKPSDIRAVAERRPVQLPKFANRSLQFRFDKELNRVIVDIIDSETHEVVRSVPPEKIVNALKELRRTQGALLDEEV